MRKHNLKDIVRNVINEQQGTPWCSYCVQYTGSVNVCGAQCNSNLNKDSLSCPACKNLFPGNGNYPQGLINTHCNQPGQPCGTETTRTLSKGEAMYDPNIQAKKGGGRNTVKLRESDLKNVINRVIGEAMNPACPNPVSCQTGFAQAPATHPTNPCECVRASSLLRKKPTKGKGKRMEMSEEKKCNARKGNSECGKGQWCNGYGAGGGTCEDNPTWGKSGGGKTKQTKQSSKHVMKLKESDLINIVRKTINESSLLVEAEGCGSEQANTHCSQATSGRGTCKGNNGECYIPHDGKMEKGDCGAGEKIGTDGTCICTNVKLCGKEVTMNGTWESLGSVVKNAVKGNLRGSGINEQDILNVLKGVNDLETDDGDEPTGRKRCGDINEFGGDRFCAKVTHKTWTITIWFSDMTLKENIELVGKSKSGVNIYEFDYINKEYGNGRYRGVMAQEVPSASKVGPGGKLMVDYSKLDVDFERLN